MLVILKVIPFHPPGTPRHAVLITWHRSRGGVGGQWRQDGGGLTAEVADGAGEIPGRAKGAEPVPVSTSEAGDATDREYHCAGGAGAAGTREPCLQADGPRAGEAGTAGGKVHSCQTASLHHWRDKALRGTDEGVGTEI